MATEITIFYSWQSDLPNSTNRGFIEEVLKKAMKQLENEVPNVQLYLDQDTRDTVGTGNIAGMIFDKIEKADIFVADTSLINAYTTVKRKCPNPNVMMELGFALSQQGESKILSFYNTAFGKFPDDLPFDLRSWKHLTYELSEGQNKTKVKTQLIKRTKQELNGMIQQIINESILDGLDSQSTFFFKVACEIALESGDREVGIQKVNQHFSHSNDELQGILECLEHEDYIDIRRSINTNQLPIVINYKGIQKYIIAFVRDADALLERVASLIVFDEIQASSVLAEKTNQPEMIIKSILEQFQDDGLITLSNVIRTETVIETFSQRLKRHLVPTS